MLFYHMSSVSKAVRAGVFICIGIGIASSSTHAAEFVVTTNADSGPGSLRQAIADANTNIEADTITFDPTVFSSPQTIILTTGELAVLRDLDLPSGTAFDISIVGPGRNLLTIDGNNQTRIFSSASGNYTFFLSGVTLKRGSSEKGGAIYSRSFLSVSDSLITENYVESGEVTGPQFRGGIGGGILAEGGISLRDSIVSNNIASGVVVINTTNPNIGDYGTSGAGGGVYLLAGFTREVINCTFIGNLARGISSPAAVNRNGASGGGGHGGAIFSGFNIVLVNSTFVGNSATGGDGGAGLSGGDAGGAEGGALVSSGGIILNATFKNNSVTGGNGGVATNPFLSGKGGEATGGAVTDASNARIANVTFVGNTATAGSGRIGGDAFGGAFRSRGDNQHHLSNTTITDNSVTSGSGTEANGQGHGGGVYSVTTNTPQFRNNIVAGNTANTAGPDIFGQFPNAFNNLIRIGDGANVVHGVNGNQVGTLVSPLEPMLGPLASNGGITETRALLNGSPAIDAGNNAVFNPLNSLPLLFDQRTFQRTVPTGGTIDIGAYEFGAPAMPVVPGSPDLRSTSDTGTSSTDNITMARLPMFDVGEVVPGATIELLRDNIVVSATNSQSSTVTVLDPTPPLDGVVQYSVRHSVGGVPSGSSGELSVTFDNTRPSGTINQASTQADPTRFSPITYTAIFNEPIGGFPGGEGISFAGSTANVNNAQAFVTNIGSGITWKIDVHFVNSDGGFVLAKILDSGYRDIAGNPGFASTSTDNVVTLDNVRPSVTINQAPTQPDPAHTQPINFIVEFSEIVLGFTAQDLVFTGSTANVSQAVVDITGGPTSYVVAISNITSSGTVRVTLPANAVQDVLGNLNLASTSTDNTVLYAPRTTQFDFDGDGKTDIGVFRLTASQWWINRSSNGTTFAATFGATTDRIVPSDYTGDGKTDIAVWRPGTGEWFVLRSENSTYFSFPFGTTGDIPAPADYDADGKADPAVFRPSTGRWFIRRSTDGVAVIVAFGSNGDVPVAGDYDGDGRADVAILRPSSGQWWLNRSTAGLIVATFGTGSDKPVQGDFTGDGKTDVAFWRPSTGQWFVLRSENFSYYSFPFGTVGDVPAPGDYDGDGKYDATVFRPSTATWYSNRSTAGILIRQFGLSGDRPVPNAFVP